MRTSLYNLPIKNQIDTDLIIRFRDRETIQYTYNTEIDR